ncbi:MAG: chromosome partitioning protein ParB, partial [Planctomycetaceae bacterium]|nr:chromosome partitioning protein ParB [Planctomycetaceae bacterium]
MDEHATPNVDTPSDAAQDKGVMRRRLGRGLNALLGGAVPDSPAGEAPANDAETELKPSDEISVELIERNPYQPRKEFDKELLLELAES